MRGRKCQESKKVSGQLVDRPAPLWLRGLGGTPGSSPRPPDSPSAAAAAGRFRGHRTPRVHRWPWSGTPQDRPPLSRPRSIRAKAGGRRQALLTMGGRATADSTSTVFHVEWRWRGCKYVWGFQKFRYAAERLSSQPVSQDTRVQQDRIGNGSAARLCALCRKLPT